MKRRLVGWLRFIGTVEIAILILALIGPGGRISVRRADDHGGIARFFIDDPSFWEAVGVNFVALNIFAAVVLVAVKIFGRRG